MFTFTIIIYILYNKKFLRTELFVDEDYNFDDVYMKEWSEKYCHPMEDVYIAAHPDEVNSFNNIEEIELKSRDMLREDEEDEFNTLGR